MELPEQSWYLKKLYHTSFTNFSQPQTTALMMSGSYIDILTEIFYRFRW